MAKSLRSKWKRKMRKVQREQADVKITKNMVEKFKKIEEEEAVSIKKNEDVARKLSVITQPANSDLPVEDMEIEKDKKKYGTKTMTDEHGQYPKWMNKRAILKTKKKVKRLKKTPKK